MTNKELQQQYERCQQWHDPEQWDILALFYMAAGDEEKAVECSQMADQCRELVTA